MFPAFKVSTAGFTDCQPDLDTTHTGYISDVSLKFLMPFCLCVQLSIRPVWSRPESWNFQWIRCRIKCGKLKKICVTGHKTRTNLTTLDLLVKTHKKESYMDSVRYTIHVIVVVLTAELEAAWASSVVIMCTKSQALVPQVISYHAIFSSYYSSFPQTQLSPISCSWPPNWFSDILLGPTDL